MIYAFIRGYIGGFGRMLMDFYVAHSFVLNAIILFYGLCVYLAHISYLKTYRRILEMLGVKIDHDGKSKTTHSRASLDYNRVNWEDVGRAYRFPLISPPKSFGVRLKTHAALSKLFSEENIKHMLQADQ